MRNGLYVFNNKILSYEKVPFVKVYGLPIVILFVLGSWFGATTAEPTVIEKLTEVEKLIVIDEAREFSREKLIIEIGYMNFRFPEIVLAQATLETGNFKSLIFQENSNLFGMKQSYRRATTAQGENRGHAQYADWKESLIDYALYYNKYLSELNEDEYYAFLKKYYAEDPSYVNKIRNLALNIEASKTFWHFSDEARYK